MPRPLALVLLAAGLGQRFGGLKQLAPVGPNGEAIMDYSVRDAIVAGFAPVVVVVRSEIEPAVNEHIRGRWPSHVRTILVCQDREPLAVEAARAGRTKPLGTAHAVLAAIRGADVAGPFAVINADDLYGAEPYRLLAEHFNAATSATSATGGALVAFDAANSVHGNEPVMRAVCQVDHGRLVGIEEGTIVKEGDRLAWTDRSGTRVLLRGDEPVSMNFWGFPPEAADALDEASRSFVASPRVATGDEVLLPDVVRSLVRRPDWPPLAVLRTAGVCVGVTRATDLASLRRAISEPAW